MKCTGRSKVRLQRSARIMAQTRSRCVQWGRLVAVLLICIGPGAFVRCSEVLGEQPWLRQDPNRIHPLSLSELKKLPSGQLEELESDFNHIVVGKKDSMLTLYFKRGMYFYKETEIDLSIPHRLVLAYGKLSPAALLYAKNHSSFLMLGLGGGAITNYFHSYIPSMHIDAVEIDPMVARLAVRYFRSEPGTNYRIHLGDGRRFVQDTKSKYDLIMGDAYGGGFVPPHMITYQFYKECASHLNPGGVLFLNLYDEEVYQRSLAALYKLFDHVHTYFAVSNTSRIVIAFNGPAPDDAELYRRARTLEDRYGFYHSLQDLISHKRVDRPEKGLQPYYDEN